MFRWPNSRKRRVPANILCASELALSLLRCRILPHAQSKVGSFQFEAANLRRMQYVIPNDPGQVPEHKQLWLCSGWACSFGVQKGIPSAFRNILEPLYSLYSYRTHADDSPRNPTIAWWQDHGQSLVESDIDMEVRSDNLS